MARHLDLEEQEQLDELKHFWKQYGNLVSWALIVALGMFAGWNGYQYWQRNQSAQAAALFEEVERIVASSDVEKGERVFTEMKDRFGSTLYAQQAGLLVAQIAHQAGNVEASKVALTWVGEKGADPGYASTARLRLAGLMVEQKDYDAALNVLSKGVHEEFSSLAADLRGDIYAFQGKQQDAIKSYQTAYSQFGGRADYRGLLETKLNALGVDPKGDAK